MIEAKGTWTVVCGKYFNRPGFELISTAFLCCNGNQVGAAMPLYVAEAAAFRLNQTHNQEGVKHG